MRAARTVGLVVLASLWVGIGLPGCASAPGAPASAAPVRVPEAPLAVYTVGGCRGADGVPYDPPHFEEMSFYRTTARGQQALLAFGGSHGRKLTTHWLDARGYHNYRLVVPALKERFIIPDDPTRLGTLLLYLPIGGTLQAATSYGRGTRTPPTRRSYSTQPALRCELRPPPRTFAILDPHGIYSDAPADGIALFSVATSYLLERGLTRADSASADLVVEFGMTTTRRFTDADLSRGSSVTISGSGGVQVGIPFGTATHQLHLKATKPHAVQRPIRSTADLIRFLDLLVAGRSMSPPHPPAGK